MSKLERCFSERTGEHWIQACENLVERHPSQAVFRKWAAISAIAGALGYKCWTHGGVRPNLFVLLAGESRSGKSSSINIVYNRVVSKLSALPGAQSNSQASWRNYVGVPMRVMFGRATPEKIIQDMSEISESDKDIHHLGTFDEPFYNSTFTIVTSEFGEFVKKQDPDIQNILSRLYDGDSDFDHRTKTNGTFHISNPCLNWIAGVTPSTFASTMPKDAHTQGFLNRMVIVYGESNRKLIAFPDEPDEGVLEKLRVDLGRIATMRGEFVWDGAAQKAFVQWVEVDDCEPAPKAGVLSLYANNRVFLMKKLAMVFSASKRVTRVITEGDFLEAKAALEEVEADMVRALDSFGIGDSGLVLAETLKSLWHYYPKGEMPVHAVRMELQKRVKNVNDVEGLMRNMVSTQIAKYDEGQGMFKLLEKTLQ